MPALSSHQSNQSTKLLLMGESGSGKSGALASLAAAGYNLRILDFDNGLDGLFNLLMDPKSSYPADAAARVHYRTLTEPRKNVGGQLVPIKSSVWQEMTRLLTHWKEPATAESPEIDLGPVNSWGPQDVLVIDTFTMLADAAMNYHLSMQGKLPPATRTQNEHRRDIGAAQELLERVLMTVTDLSIKCNVIVNSHITYVQEGGQGMDAPAEAGAQVVGFPSSIGRALSPKIPRYFNSVLLAKTQGSGTATKRKIFTQSQGVVAAKTSAPLKVLPNYPIESGLADYFKAVRS